MENISANQTVGNSVELKMSRRLQDYALITGVQPSLHEVMQCLIRTALIILAL